MVSSPPNRLSLLQRTVLREFFARERGFFLTGDGALAGFHLGHRTTDDLDLFTTSDEAFERGRFVLEELASKIGGRLEIRQAAPRFLRAVLTTDQGAVVIGLVRDQLHQLHPDKLDRDGIFIDRADEILANKLTTIVGEGPRSATSLTCFASSAPATTSRMRCPRPWPRTVAVRQRRSHGSCPR